jgi:aspartate/methionine/tyrosine aminotransferase
MSSEKAAFTKEAARAKVHPVIREYYQGLLEHRYPNALRAMEDCSRDMTQILIDNGFPPSLYPLVATIGDVSALGFNKKLTPDEIEELRKNALLFGEVVSFKPADNDPFETEFADLSNKMGLKPVKKYNKEDLKFNKIISRFQQIFTQVWGNGKSPHRYETSGRGSEKSRKIFAAQANSLGIKVDSDDVWLTDGGMGALDRASISINSFIDQKFNRKARVLAPNPCFTMVPGAQKELGLDVSYIDVQDKSAQELDVERLNKYFLEQEEMANRYGGKKDYIPDILYLTLADNPTARSVDPEKLRGVITEALKMNEEMVFFFDMAYMKLIPEKKAKAIMKVIKETGALKHSVFAFSDSKRLGRPGSRLGAIVVPKDATLYGKQLGTKNGRIQETTRTIHPGFSVETDFMYQAINQFVKEEDLVDYKRLLRQRQQALLEVLQALNPGEKYFKNLDKIYIPQNEDDLIPEEMNVQDVPLYLWVEINKENKDFLEKCFEIIEDLNIVGVPGTVFKDENHMRFSVGVISTIDILNKSPEVFARWAKKN